MSDPQQVRLLKYRPLRLTWDRTRTCFSSRSFLVYIALFFAPIAASGRYQMACGDEPIAKATTSHEQTNVKLKYLALGDSYTIGESVEEAQRWPIQLTNVLASENLLVDAPIIVAKTGWTTDELDAAIDEQELKNDFDLVTLLIGVNNQYRQRSVDTYKPEFDKLLKRAIGFAGGRAGRVVVVSIPDYGITPFVAKKFQESPETDSKFASGRIAAELDSYNEAAKTLTLAHGARWVDITGISRTSGAQTEMLAEDGLHPSARMYQLWVNEIAPVAVESLKNPN